MTRENFLSLSRGDIIKHKANPKTYVVDANHGQYITAVTTVDVTNPSEWELILKANHIVINDNS